MKWRTLSLRNLLFGVIGTLSLLLLTVAGMSAFESWQELETASDVVDDNSVTDSLLESGRYLIEERDITVTALQASDAGTTLWRADLAESRTNVDQSVKNALAQVSGQHEFAEKDRHLDQVEGAYSRITQLRSEVDASLSRAIDDRDGALVQSWFQAMTELITMTEDLRTAAARVANSADAVTGNFSVLKHFAWVMADYAGRERGSFAGLIFQELPIRPRQLRLLSDYRGRVELAWSALQEAAQTEGVDASVKAAIDDAQATFMGSFEQTRVAVYQAGISAQDYPLDARTWMNASTEAMATIYRVQEALVAANENHAETSSAAALTLLIFLGALLAAGVSAAVVSFGIVARRVVKPINEMTAVMAKLAGGDTEVEVAARDRKDEIGDMAQAVQVFKENMIEADALAAEQAKEQAAKEAQGKRVMELCAAFDQTAASALESVASAATEMQTTSEGMSATAEETNRQASVVASASEQATANVQTVASAAEEMSASIGEIGRQVEQSAAIATRAVAESEKTNGTVQGLAEAAEKIGAVVELIAGIAEQTNLLALNATIEAARAGDAGKGFAVVASEVKSLANQTAKATEEIGAQIAGMQSVAGEAVDAIGGIGKTITEVNEIAATIAAAVEEQGTATQDIARNVQEAARGTQEVTSNITGVSTGAEATGKAANQVLESAGQLSRQSEELRGAVDKFLDDIRAA